MFHVKHSRTPTSCAARENHHKRRAKHAVHTARAGEALLCRPAGTPVAADGIGVSRRRGMRPPPHGSFGTAETPVRTLAAKRQTGAADHAAARTISHHRISLYNNEENCVNFARKPREKPPLPTDFSRGFSAVKHARETSGEAGGFSRRRDGNFLPPLSKTAAENRIFGAAAQKNFCPQKSVFSHRLYIIRLNKIVQNGARMELTSGRSSGTLCKKVLTKWGKLCYHNKRFRENGCKSVGKRPFSEVCFQAMDPQNLQGE